jgi:hypothetical protein
MLGHRREERQSLRRVNSLAFRAACLLAFAMLSPPALAQGLDQATVQVTGNALDVRWADAEDVLRAFVTPANPRAGEPLTITLKLGPIEGAAYTGPVTLCLREQGTTGEGETVTVMRSGEGWRAVLTPARQGHHALDFTYRTTRMKAVHAALDVTGGQVPPIVGYLAVAVLLVAALAFGIRLTLRAPSRR